MEGSFARNSTIALSGNTVSILVGFVFTPFIARIYTPEAYGLFAFFISISQNVAIISTLQLPRAFVLPERESEFSRILNSAFFCVLVVVAATAFVLVGFGDSIFSYFDAGSGQTELLVYLIPISVLLYALNDIFKSWNIRNKLFTRNAVTQVFSSTVSRGSTLVYGVATAGNVWGLLFGDMISKVLENTFLASRILRNGASNVFSLSKSELLRTLKEYRSYPLFMLPGTWVQCLITQLPVYVALFFFDSDSAGYYSFANSLLNLPANLLAGAVAPVFLQKASETFRRNPSDIGRIVQSLANKLFFASLVPMVFLTVFGDYIFSFVLGEQWVNSGKMASYMGVYFLFLILNYPLVSLYRIYKKEHLSLIISLAVLVLAISGLAIGRLFNDFMLCIALFSAASLIGYLINILVILKFSGLPSFRLVFKWAGSFLAASAICYLLRALVEDALL